MMLYSGAVPGFQVRGGGALKIYFGVFRVKNHDFTPKNHIFPILGGGGGGAPGALPPGSAPDIDSLFIISSEQYFGYLPYHMMFVSFNSNSRNCLPVWSTFVYTRVLVVLVLLNL
jgi:hypothetical protein